MSSPLPRSRLVGFDPEHQRLNALARDTATVHHALVAIRDEEFARMLTYRWHQLVAPAYTTAELTDLDALTTQAKKTLPSSRRWFKRAAMWACPSGWSMSV